MDSVKQGAIVYISERGFGFIVEDMTSKDRQIFFHASQVIDPTFNELQKGNRVEYLEKETEKGLNAISVVVIN